jgi:GR25 family glycosyltransferase involved in LPS biosynthesis
MKKNENRVYYDVDTTQDDWASLLRRRRLDASLQEREAYYDHYHEESRAHRLLGRRRECPFIMVSMTTRRRLDLFKRTVASLLASCLDLDRVDEFVCVDDGSAPEDVREMRRVHPFFTFIIRKEGDVDREVCNSHARSMNIIRDYFLSKPSCQYLFHVEDDWEFILKRTYIADALCVLNNARDTTIGQVLFNEHYIEVPQELGYIVGGEEGGVVAAEGGGGEGGVRYVLHTYCSTDAETAAFWEGRRRRRRNGRGEIKKPEVSSVHWPHYSLRPGILKRAVFACANLYFDERRQRASTNWSFEFKFALSYVAHNFKTAFLPGVHTEHIGRKTGRHLKTPSVFIMGDDDGDDGDEPNAYDAEEPKAYDADAGFAYVVINLQHRADRLAAFRRTIVPLLPLPLLPPSSSSSSSSSSPSPPPPSPSVLRVAVGTYGRDIRNQPEYRDMFVPNAACGMAGCALSHMRVWRDAAEAPGPLVVFEDDIRIRDGVSAAEVAGLFIELKSFMSRHRGFDVVFLCHTAVPATPDLFRYTEDSSPFKRIKRVRCAKELTRFSKGGTGAYVISSSGRKKLLARVERTKLRNYIGIDTWMYQTSDLLDVNNYVMLDTVFASVDTPLDTDVIDPTLLFDDY